MATKIDESREGAIACVAAMRAALETKNIDIGGDAGLWVETKKRAFALMIESAGITSDRAKGVLATLAEFAYENMAYDRLELEEFKPIALMSEDEQKTYWRDFEENFARFLRGEDRPSNVIPFGRKS